MPEVLFDAFIDSLKVFGLAFILYFILSFLEGKIANIFQKHSKTTPLIGASCGLIPQCGISVVAADLYHKKSITAGTLLAVFFACSDEALPIMMTSNKIIYLVPLLLIKFIFGFLLGLITDIVIRQNKLKKGTEEVHMGCCHHEIDNENEKPFHKHFVHPFVHSLKIWIYVWIVNFIFGTIFYLAGEEAILHFLETNRYLGPLFATAIGIIPNCASSVLLTELFMMNGLSFGALVSGLCVNAGLGFVYLIKYKDERFKAIQMMSILLIYSLVIGYLVLLIMNVIGI